MLSYIPSCIVYLVGNISYDATEAQLMDIFNSVGQIASFRLVHDKETGKAKGFGFVEYYDTETAMSAVRNLNNVDCNGRSLRVDLADQDFDSWKQHGPKEQKGGQGNTTYTTFC